LYESRELLAGAAACPMRQKARNSYTGEPKLFLTALPKEDDQQTLFSSQWPMFVKTPALGYISNLPLCGEVA